MKKYVFLFLLMITAHVFGQKLYKKDLLKIEKDIYKSALNNLDLPVAKNAVYHIIALEGEQSPYLDSLAFIYFNQKAYVPCVKTADRILKQRPSLAILELKAAALEQLNAFKEAIAAYEKIYAQKKEAPVAYKLAELQQKLKRSAEAYETLKSAENLKFDDRQFVVFPKDQKGGQQKVPLKAAYYNLLAQTSYDLHNYDLAIEYYDKALKLFPDFYVAKQNKAVVKMLNEKIKSINNSKK